MGGVARAEMMDGVEPAREGEDRESETEAEREPAAWSTPAERQRREGEDDPPRAGRRRRGNHRARTRRGRDGSGRRRRGLDARPRRQGAHVRGHRGDEGQEQPERRERPQHREADAPAGHRERIITDTLVNPVRGRTGYRPRRPRIWYGGP